MEASAGMVYPPKLLGLEFQLCAQLATGWFRLAFISFSWLSVFWLFHQFETDCSPPFQAFAPAIVAAPCALPRFETSPAFTFAALFPAASVAPVATCPMPAVAASLLKTLFWSPTKRACDPAAIVRPV